MMKQDMVDMVGTLGGMGASGTGGVDYNPWAHFLVCQPVIHNCGKSTSLDFFGDKLSTGSIMHDMCLYLNVIICAPTLNTVQCTALELIVERERGRSREVAAVSHPASMYLQEGTSIYFNIL